MKHIKTKHEDEAKALKDFAVLAKKDEPVIADEKVEAAARKLFVMLKQADENELEMSRLRGILMNALKGNTLLKDKNGVLLCSWVGGNASSSTDWKGLCEKYKVSEKDIADFTKTKIGGRRFSIELED